MIENNERMNRCVSLFQGMRKFFFVCLVIFVIVTEFSVVVEFLLSEFLMSCDVEK